MLGVVPAHGFTYVSSYSQKEIPALMRCPLSTTERNVSTENTVDNEAHSPLLDCGLEEVCQQENSDRICTDLIARREGILRNGSGDVFKCYP